MAVFKGKATEGPALPTEFSRFIHLLEKRVRANPDWVRVSGQGDWRSYSFNAWDMDPDPRDSRFYRYAVRLYRYGEGFSVIVNLNINDSLRRLFRTYEDALRVFEEIHPYTTKKGLWNRGFQTW